MKEKSSILERGILTIYRERTSVPFKHLSILIDQVNGRLKLVFARNKKTNEYKDSSRLEPTNGSFIPRVR